MTYVREKEKLRKEVGGLVATEEEEEGNGSLRSSSLIFFSRPFRSTTSRVPFFAFPFLVIILPFAQCAFDVKATFLVSFSDISRTIMCVAFPTELTTMKKELM